MLTVITTAKHLNRITLLWRVNCDQMLRYVKICIFSIKLHDLLQNSLNDSEFFVNFATVIRDISP